MKRDPTQRVCFSPIKKAIKNPYIGFTSFQRFRGEPLYSDIVVRPENHGTETEKVECYPVGADVEQKGDLQGFYPDTTVAYIRILWKEFEPRRKEYNYALIEEILRQAREKGQTVTFRLMPHSTRASDDVPDWLKDLIPCPERPEGMRVKDSPADPRYLLYFGEAIEAIAKRFDDDPVLDAVDISLTGAWGEGHKISEYPKSALKALVDVYTHNFRKTHLIGQTAAPWLVSYACKTKPCGWRGDGVGESKHMNVFYPAAAKAMPRDAWKRAPISFESYWWLGEWDRRGWDFDKIIEKTLSWHISTFNAKSLPIPEKYRGQIERWESRMGYHFHLLSIEYPDKAHAGDTLRCRMLVENKGVAPIYRAVPLRLRLKSGDGEISFQTEVDVRNWLPGVREECFDLPLPKEAAVGAYDLELSLSGEGYPFVAFETQTERDGIFCKVGEVTLCEECEEIPLIPQKKEKPSVAKRRAYLLSFLSDFDYQSDAREELLSVFDQIFADQKSRAFFQEIERRYKRCPDTRFSLLGQVADRLAEQCGCSVYPVHLVVLILLSESNKAVYEKRGLSPEMWRRNMLDLKYCNDLCKILKGHYGTYCFFWSGRFFSGTRFTFGKLQFERGPLGKAYEKDGIRLQPEDQVIYIHIPRTGEPLLPEDVDAACAAASDFFKQRYEIEEVIFACHSWLLYPENEKILSKTSNLYSFISRFEILDVEEDTEYKELWRLFDKDYDGNADALPQDTSLRRAYAQRVKEKLPLGIALGVWVYRQ